MSKISQPIVFFGTEDFSRTALERLIATDFKIAAVITKPDSLKGRGQKMSSPAVKLVANQHQIPILQPNKLSEVRGAIEALESPLGVLVSYGKIIPQSIIDLFIPGIINLHPSLLPQYRGPSPIETAILNGDQQTGVSIMQLSAGMDAGPVYAQKILDLNGNENRLELYEKLAEIGSELLISILPGIASGSLTAIPQDDTRATYTKLLSKNDSPLQPDKMSASQCERHIRAYQGFPKSKLTFFDYDCVILKASVAEAPKTPLDVLCQDGAYLIIEELLAPSGRTMSADDFLRGYGR